MSGRRNSLKVIEDQVYEGEIIVPEKKSNDLQKLELENNHALSIRKMEVLSGAVDIGKQLVNILAVRENSKARIDEIDAHIRQLEQATRHEVAIRSQERKAIETKGMVVADILAKLTPVLADSRLSTEDKNMAIEVFERTINKVLNENE